MLGNAKRVSITKEHTNIVDGSGKKKDIEARVNQSTRRSRRRRPTTTRRSRRNG
jgi:chaperonin GroEL (HSP60 family)